MIKRQRWSRLTHPSELAQPIKLFHFFELPIDCARSSHMCALTNALTNYNNTSVKRKYQNIYFDWFAAAQQTAAMSGPTVGGAGDGRHERLTGLLTTHTHLFTLTCSAI